MNKNTQIDVILENALQTFKWSMLYTATTDSIYILPPGGAKCTHQLIVL